MFRCLGLCGNGGCFVRFLFLSAAQLLSHNHRDGRNIFSLSPSLSLCASGNSKLTFSSWNAASVFERLWNCSGEQHRTAALPPRLYSPIFTRAEINEESERYACYKNERHGKRFPSRSHSKAEKQSETVLQVSSENKVAYRSWRQFL